MSAVSYVDRRDVTNRLARVHITDGLTVAGWLGSLDPLTVREISDQDLAAIVGGTVSPPGGLPAGSYGAGSYGIGPYGGAGALSGLFPGTFLFPSSTLFPHD